MNSSTEQQAFVELEALGCPAVPAIIERMDDERHLPDPRISLTNKSPDAFEGKRFYGPQKVVDALAAILNQLTGQDFGFIYNGCNRYRADKNGSCVARFLAQNSGFEALRWRVSCRASDPQHDTCFW